MNEPDPASPAAAALARVTSPARTDLTSGIRTLPVWAYVVIAAVYLAIVQGLGKLLTSGLNVAYAAPTNVTELWRALTVPVLVSLVFVYAVVAVLGWWRPVFTDDRPVQRWVLVLPGIMVITAFAGMNYTGLARHGGGFTVLLAATMLGVGFAEEGMFRGLGVVTFRRNGFTEPRVALWTCVLFGLAHATNLFSEGPRALIQVLVTVAAGYFFYLIRRASHGLLIPAVVHGLWDFGLVSSQVTLGKSYLGAVLFILADVVLAVIVLIRRHHIEPAVQPAGVGG
jgi:membrane protease YdiL (CAAX protease family)